MQFNPVIRGKKREQNTEEAVFKVLDQSFMCTVSFLLNDVAMQIPTAYGRDGNSLYFHGAMSNSMLQAVCSGQKISVGVTFLDGLVLAKNLFHTSVNYRSVILIGTAEKIDLPEEQIHGLEVITNQIIPGRWEEVSIGSDKEVTATKVVKFNIESASVKIRTGGPAGDEDIQDETIWSGHIPLATKALTPIQDEKNNVAIEPSKSVSNFIHKTNEYQPK